MQSLQRIRYMRAYRVKNRLRINAQMREYHKKYRVENKEKCNAWTRKYYHLHIEKQPLRSKKYRERMKKTNPEKLRERGRLNAKRFRERRPVEHRLRCRLANAFKDYSKFGKLRRAKEYGVDFEKICQYLGAIPKQRGKWHIDHIIPLAMFDLDDPEQVKVAFAPENHQWLSAKANYKKADKNDPILYKEVMSKIAERVGK